MKNETNRSAAPLLLLIAGFFLILVAVVSFYFLRSQPNTSATTSLSEEDPLTEVPRVNLNEAKRAYDAGTAVFVDVRAREYYDQEHIAGAISIPLSDITERMDELDPNSWIITY
jgi:hypothetical protein